MLPSEALKNILKYRNELETRPYDNRSTAMKLDQAYRDFDDAIQSSLLELIKHSDDHENHHEGLMHPWLNDPEYIKTLHQYDHEFDQSNKGDK